MSLAAKSLFNVTGICGMPVRPCVPNEPNTTMKVISGVDDTPDDALMKEIFVSKKFLMYVLQALAAPQVLDALIPILDAVWLFGSATRDI